MRAQDWQLDDRREVWQLLQRLPQRRRVAFIRHACTMARAPDDVAEVRVTREPRNVHEAYMDLCYLQVCFRLDLEKALAELVRWVRRWGGPLSTAGAVDSVAMAGAKLLGKKAG